MPDCKSRLKASKLSNAQAQRQVIARDRERTLRLAERARRALATAMQRLEARVTHSGQLLAALSYRGVLARGFALVRDERGLAVHAAAVDRTRRPAQSRICRRTRRGDGGCGSAGGHEPGKTGRQRTASRAPNARRSRSAKAAVSSAGGRSARTALQVRLADEPPRRREAPSQRSRRTPSTAPAIRRRAFANRRALRHRCRDGRARARLASAVPAIA